MDPTLIISLFELAANTTLSVLGANGTIPPQYATLASALESSINPLILALKGGAAPSQDVLAAYAAMIGTLNALQQTTGIDPKVLTQVKEYIGAAQDGTTGFLLAQKGYDPANYSPVAAPTPVA